MSTRSPTIKRILKEASELQANPSPDFQAAPLESDLFEWHFTLRGPPAPSPFDGGVYHGRIVLPPAYPLKPPSFRFTTPTSRFEVNREICLSISGHHEETWQPAWGIRTALVAIRSFMDTDAKGQLGGMDASEEVRKRFAKQSVAVRCVVCQKTNGEIIAEHETAVKEAGTDKKEEVVPEELRLAYRDDLSKSNGETKEQSEPQSNGKPSEVPSEATTVPAQAPADKAIPIPATVIAAVPAAFDSQAAPGPAHRNEARIQQQRQRQNQDDGIPAWIDKAIYGVLAALVALIWLKYLA